MKGMNSKLALAIAATGPFASPTRDTLVARSYPLTRAVFAYVNRAPDTLLDAKVREFLDYALGADGQREIARTDYLPLSVASADASRAALK